MEWDELRGIRQGLLKGMDVYQLSIVYDGLTDTQKAGLQQYRQDLLDLPQNYSTPQEAYDNIPTKPEWMVN
tara:strand:- start:663 stop:875 length:213 start_codon:yes stop_codon:yes gene_type:complete